MQTTLFYFLRFVKLLVEADVVEIRVCFWCVSFFNWIGFLFGLFHIVILCLLIVATFNKHFGKYGEITDSVIMKDRYTGQPRGFGFITYADPSVVDKVIEDTHIINGKQVNYLSESFSLYWSFYLVLATDNCTAVIDGINILV